jgi:hypothetical protein
MTEKQDKSRGRRAWTEKENAQVIDSLRRNNKLRDVANELAGKLDRSWGAIMNRARLLGQDLPEFQKASTRRRWTAKEDAYLHQHWEQQTLEELAAHLERSEGAVKMRLSVLGFSQRRRRGR